MRFGWYGEREEPGVFRDVLPAWNDQNLISIARQVKTSLFFAHVRAADVGPIQRSNCHPFAFEQLVVHAQRSDWRVRKGPASIWKQWSTRPTIMRLGTTDSETIFLLLLSDGLTDDPMGAFSRTVGRWKKSCNRMDYDRSD